MQELAHLIGNIVSICRKELRNGSCYHSVQNLLSSSLLPKCIKIKIHRTTIFPVVVYGYETWSLTLSEECRLRVLTRIFGPKMG